MHCSFSMQQARISSLKNTKSVHFFTPKIELLRKVVEKIA